MASKISAVERAITALGALNPTEVEVVFQLLKAKLKPAKVKAQRKVKKVAAGEGDTNGEN